MSFPESDTPGACLSSGGLAGELNHLEALARSRLRRTMLSALPSAAAGNLCPLGVAARVADVTFVPAMERQVMVV